MSVIKCNLCEKVFLTKSQLKAHTNRAIKCVGNKFNCEYCKNSYTTKRGLKNHMENVCTGYIKFIEEKGIKEQATLPYKLKDEKKIIRDEDFTIIIHPNKNKNNNNKNDDNEATLFANYMEQIERKEREKKEKKQRKEKQKEYEWAMMKKDIENLKMGREIKENVNELENPKTLITNNQIINGDNNTVNNIHINNNNMLTVQYIMANYNECPPIKPMSNYNEVLHANFNNSGKLTNKNRKGKNKSLKNEKIAFVETLLDIYSNNRLSEFIGDIIISNYKNVDSSQQSFWVTDTTRYSFLTKVLRIDKNQSFSLWVRDKSGEEVKKLIINPLLKYINGAIILYQKQPHVQLDADLNLKCIKIAKLITNGNMSTSIIKQIAKEFSFKDRLIQ